MKNSKLPSIVVLMILTLITVLFWISFSVYRSFKSPASVDVSPSVIAPLTPNFDTNTMEKVKTRIYP